MANQGGTHDQHVKAGQQSHKNEQQNQGTRQASASDNRNNESTRGGTHEQHVKAGQQSHKNNH